MKHLIGLVRPCPFGALLFDFSPRFVLRAPGDLAGVVGQFLWRAELVALVPRQYVNRQRLRGVGPQRVFINVITTFVTRLVAQCLGYGDESAGFVVVVDGFATGAVGLRGAAFPSQGVAVPAE